MFKNNYLRKVYSWKEFIWICTIYLSEMKKDDYWYTIKYNINPKGFWFFTTALYRNTSATHPTNEGTTFLKSRCKFGRNRRLELAARSLHRVLSYSASKKTSSNIAKKLQSPNPYFYLSISLDLRKSLNGSQRNGVTNRMSWVWTKT